MSQFRMGCTASVAPAFDTDEFIYCHRPGGTVIRPGMDGVQEWEFQPVSVTVPRFTAPGMLIAVVASDGTALEVQCPENMTPGDTFQALYYHSADELVNSAGTDWHVRRAGGDANGDRVGLQLCNTCGFGTASRDCFKCGGRVGHGQCIAAACRDCVFGIASKQCARCGSYFGDGPKHSAIICALPLMRVWA